MRRDDRSKALSGGAGLTRPSGLASRSIGMQSCVVDTSLLTSPCLCLFPHPSQQRSSLPSKQRAFDAAPAPRSFTPSSSLSSSSSPHRTASTAAATMQQHQQQQRRRRQRVAGAGMPLLALVAASLAGAAHAFVPPTPLNKASSSSSTGLATSRASTFVRPALSPMTRPLAAAPSSSGACVRWIGLGGIERRRAGLYCRCVADGHASFPPSLPSHPTHHHHHHHQQTRPRSSWSRRRRRRRAGRCSGCPRPCRRGSSPWRPSPRSPPTTPVRTSP